ncbi:MAG: glycoside hydrolase family 3 N-terminal domain-containing protein [Pseudomonadota bacterium]
MRSRGMGAVLCAVALSLLSLVACGAQQQGPAAPERSDPMVALVAQMTTQEKLGQLHQMPGGRSKALNSRLTEDEYDRVRAGLVGSYLHVAGAEPLAELQRVAVEESRLGIPLLFAMDVVHGYRTIFPVPLAMASTWDPDDWQQAARISAVEASASGLHWTFAPMVDVTRDARWGRVVEGAGSDPYLGARMAAAQVRGYQGSDLSADDTILAATKHFGAYGAPLGGRDYGTADLSERTLHEVYLPPFYVASEAGSATMMTAFNDIGGVPTTSNGGLINGVLRSQWGFDGMIVSDWNAVIELINHGVAADRSSAAAQALKAGVDMEMTSGSYVGDLPTLVSGDPNLAKALDASVLRVLRAKERLGLFDDPYQYHRAEREATEILTDEQRAVARRVASKAVVLLKNEQNQLPITEGAGRLAVIGALADDALTQLGSWRAQGREDDVVSILQGLEELAPDGVDVLFARGAGTGDVSPPGLAEAAALANASDHVLLVVGEDYDLSGEARSRSAIELPASQKALVEAVLATDTPVTVLLVTGRPLAIPQIAEQADAVLVTWMLGVEAGHAVADIVYGRVSPGGRLPISFPRATGQVPWSYAEFPSGRPADPDLSRDTNRYIDLPITPQYAFGHGLSYTTFAYRDVRASSETMPADGSVTISVTVTNTGSRAGDEVVQLYARDPLATVARPRLELRGFKRISLEPGEERTVSFEVAAAQLAIFDAPGRWLVEQGDLIFHVGASSADLKGSVAVRVEGQAVSTRPAAAIETQVTVR